MQKLLRHEQLKVIVMIIVVVALGVWMTNAVTAQSIIIEEPNDCASGPCLGFDPIEIPTFLSPDAIRNYSIASYVALLFGLAFAGLTLLWFYLVIRAAVDIIRSQGSEDLIASAKNRITGVFMSITFLFGFMALIVVVASFFGLGEFWRWPQYLSFCQDGRLYYTHYLELDPSFAAAPGQGPVDTIERSCYGTSPSATPPPGATFNFGL